MDRMISGDSSNGNKTRLSFFHMKDPMFVSLLKEFKNLLKSSVGIEGCLKLLVSGGGYVQLLSSSSQIIQHYDQFSCPMILYIIQILKGQVDFGLYSGIIISSLLEYFLTLQYLEKITSEQSVSIVESLMRSCHKLFDANKLKIKLDFDTVTEFTPVVKSILNSKFKQLLLSDAFINCLNYQITKSFLYTLDTENLMSGKVMVKISKGENNSTFYPGIIYELVDGDDWISDLVVKHFKQKTELKVILFTTFLDNDNTLVNNDFKPDKMPIIMKVLDEILKLGVDIIACQKVVHKDIILLLRRRSVVVLERLGAELASNLERLTGSFPISSIDRLDLNDLTHMIGVINKVSFIEIGVNCFLLLERFSSSIATLLVQTSSLSDSQQIKIVIEQALSSLQALITHPFVCPGAGCFEVSLCYNIQALDKENTIGKEIYHWFMRTFIEAAGLSLPIWIDSIYRHAWSSDDQSQCNCQLLSKDLVLQKDGLYQMFSLNEPFDFNVNLCDPNPITKLSENSVVDLFVLKRNSIISALETCINLFGIGSVVQTWNC